VSRNTGHVAFVQEAPRRLDPEGRRWLAHIADATSIPHGDHPGPHQHPSGFGSGTLTLFVETGGADPTVCGWCGLNTRIDFRTHIALGRAVRERDRTATVVCAGTSCVGPTQGCPRGTSSAMAYDPRLIPDDFAADERAAAEHALADLAQRGLSGDKLSGDFLVRRRYTDVIYVPLGIILAVCLRGLEQVALGVALGVGTVGLFAWRSSRRIARFRIGRDGVFSVPGRIEALDWSRVVRVEFGWSQPGSADSLQRIALGALELSFGFVDGSVLTLARGPLWRVQPTRESVGFIPLGRWLADRATAAGMVVTPRSDQGFTARRS